MRLTPIEKQEIKRELTDRLKGQPEIRKVVIFGSFPTSAEPHDLDIAVFQDSDQTYLPLAMKYRRLLRPIAARIPLDVLPLRSSTSAGWFLREQILRGEVVYER